MKYIIILGDGMADEPLHELAGKTPLMAARTPVLDELAAKSEVGLVKTIPEGMTPGSDTANLSVLGYDPKQYYTGRSPLEALSIGVAMKESDVAIRSNLVTLSEKERFAEKEMLDHSAGEISTKEAALLLDAVRKEFADELFSFYTGTSYRHLLIWNQGETVDLTAPHDILGKKIGSHLPADMRLKVMMERSYTILDEHPVNMERRKRGQNPANSLWFWGAGTKPSLTPFKEKTGMNGAMISAVDLLKGIAVGAGMRSIEVEGADGTLHTNYEGKAQAATDALLKDGCDFVYVHVEAADEMGHQGSAERKVQAIEFLDQKVIFPIKETMERAGEEFRLLVLPDHPTPVSIRTHTADPVPYLLYDSTEVVTGNYGYSEEDAKRTGNFVQQGYQLIDYLFGRHICS